MIDGEEAIGEDDITIDLNNSNMTIGAILDQCAQQWSEQNANAIENRRQNYGPSL